MPYPTTGYNANPWDFYNNNASAMRVPIYQNLNPQQNTFSWVQGEQAAKSYPVAPGSQVLMFDSDEPVFYIKKADQTGRPFPLEIYDFKRREEKETLPEVNVSYLEFATKDDVRNIIREELKALKSTHFKTNKPKEASNNA